MYFPSAAYPIDSMRMSADAQPGKRLFYGDMQFSRWLHGGTFHTFTRNFFGALDSVGQHFQYIDFVKRKPEYEGSLPHRQLPNVC